MTGIFLEKLLANLPIAWECDAKLTGIKVRNIRFDSRSIEPGDLFVALPGGSVDGHQYIPRAVKQGALAVVGSRNIPIVGAPYILVENSRVAMAHLAAAYFGHPARKLTVIGVTGTDGKTTTANLIYQILKAAGKKAGMISTVNAVIGDEIIDTGFHVTTPEAIDIQGYLAKMVEAGLEVVVLESTSHGLAQHRVTACEFDIAVVTNITHEHLDYHGTYEEYLAAKAMLFSHLESTVEKPSGNPRLAVINGDDGSFSRLINLVRGRKTVYSLEKGADYTARDINSSPQGVDFSACGPGFEIPVHFNIPGRFNASNCLAAIAATVEGMGINPAEAASGISALEGVPGRMEAIDLGQNFLAIVDFAHTPNALERAIETGREMTRGKVITVFGSAGLRDRQKRRMMAEVSVRNADITILTAEDPRTESLDAILAQMADAAQQAGGIEGKTFFRIPDRGEAIRMAVKLATPGDLVMACGKGHEQSMCFETTEYLWDDRTAMQAALAESLKQSGPGMPLLPTSAM